MDSHKSVLLNKEKYIEESNKKMRPWWDTFEKESDRSVGIVAASLLNVLLEELIREFYVKDRHVADLFKNDHLLMTFYSKINVAYYSGYIPKVIYHDLKIVCKIRNRFAHSLASGLDFTEKTLVSLIQECELRPKTMDDIFAPKLKYMLIVQQLADHLIMISLAVREMGPKQFVEYFNIEKFDFSEATLTKSKIEKIIKEGYRNLEGGDKP
jgi:DNA-binding MltR family transcriptional regulator